jgi:hypothetical protein
MTEQNTGASPEGSTESQTTEVDTPDPSKGLAEARDKYLAQRDEARAERDALTERVAQFQRAEVERLAAEHLSMPGDLFSLSGNEIGDYLNEDGNVDPDKVAADVAAMLAERPGLNKRALSFVDPSQGLGGPSKPTPTWADLLKLQ